MSRGWTPGPARGAGAVGGVEGTGEGALGTPGKLWLPVDSASRPRSLPDTESATKKIALLARHDILGYLGNPREGWRLTTNEYPVLVSAMARAKYRFCHWVCHWAFEWAVGQGAAAGGGVEGPADVPGP